MGDVARCSIDNSELLYKLFGINAELLIDHAWGRELTTIPDVKKYQPSSKSLSSGQVLSCPYSFQQAETIVKEMTDSLTLELVQKQLTTNSIILTVEYDRENRSTNSVTDRYDRSVPKPAQGTLRLNHHTASTKLLTQGFLELYHAKVNPDFTIRKVTLAANNLQPESASEFVLASSEFELTQTDFFTNYTELEHRQKLARKNQQKEKQIQKAILKIRNRYGKNAILRGINFEDGATGQNRHRQIGGHRA